MFQDGMWIRTLCEGCQNSSQRAYNSAFCVWTRQLDVIARHPSVWFCGGLPFVVNTLAVAKQFAVLAVAMADKRFIDSELYVELREFATTPGRQKALMHSRLWVYAHVGPPVQLGMLHAISTSGGPSSGVVCQVGLVPVGLFVTDATDSSRRWGMMKGLSDVTHWSRSLPGERLEWLAVNAAEGGLRLKPLPKNPSRRRYTASESQEAPYDRS